MAETRTVGVLLTANIAAFRQGMNNAARTTRVTANSIRTQMNRVARDGENSLKAVRAASLGLVAAFGFAVYAAAKFEKAMAGVKAVTQAGSRQMTAMREAALEAGRTTQYSATEAAGAMEELAKAGISADDIIGGALKGSLNLAAAAGVDLAEAAEIAATSMVVFGLEGKDVGHVADVLAAAANKSATDVHQLGLSMRMAGQVASQTGLDLEDTTGALALMASEGLKGSDAGTSLKVMLQRLVPQSQEAKRTMEALGFSAYDAQGNFIGLHGVAAEMKESFAGLTPEARNAAMATIFGSDAVRAANILYKHGAEGVREYTDAVNDHGYAAAVAQTRMDSLIGDLNLLKSTLEVALIESGSAANGVLREMVQWVTRLVNAYNSLPPGLQQAVTLLGGVVGVVGLVGASMLLMLPRIGQVRAELRALGVTAAGTRAALLTMSKVGLVLGATAALAWGVDKLMDSFEPAPANVSKLTRALLEFQRSGTVAGEAARIFGDDLSEFGDAVARVAHPGGLERTRDFLHSVTHFGMDNSDDLEEAREQLEALDQALTGMVSSGASDAADDLFRQFAELAEEGGTSTEKLLTLLPQYQEALANSGTEAALAAEAQSQLGDEAAMTADELADQRTEAEKLTEALNALNGTAIDAAEAEINFQDSIDTITKTLNENGLSLDVNTRKGRESKSAILDAASAAQEYAQAIAEQTGSQEEGNRVLEEAIGQLRETLRAAGYSEAQIRELTDAYAQLPSEVSTEVNSPGAAHSIEQLQRLKRQLDDVPGGKSITVRAPTDDVIQALRDVGYTVEELPNRRVRITAPTDGARDAVQDLQQAIDDLRDRTVTVRYNQIFSQSGASTWTDSSGHSHQAAKAWGGIVRRAGGGAVWGFPIGGVVRGPGTETSDSIPALLSNNEFVIRAAAVRKYGVAMFERLNAMRFASGGRVGYASGGKVELTPKQEAALEREKERREREREARLAARREVRSSTGDFAKTFNDSAREIRAAGKALAHDLGRLGGTGKKLAREVERTSNKLEKLANARDKLAARIEAAQDFSKETRGGVEDFLAMGGDAPTTWDLIQQQKAQLAEASKFQKDIRALEKRGLHRDLLEQVIAEGPGGQLAGLLRAASPAQLREMNRLAGKGSKLAASTGRLAADAMYDAGKHAGDGFLAGLKAQEAALQKQMDKLGKSMVAAIKKALDIKSPSRVMRDQVGRQVGAGLIQGMDGSLTAVEAAASRMSAAAVAPLSGTRFTTPARGGYAALPELTAVIHARVFVGDREITDIARCEVDARLDGLDRALAGRRTP